MLTIKEMAEQFYTKKDMIKIKKRILILDNDKEFVDELSEVLGKYKIIKQYSSANIIKTIKYYNPDLILINYRINGNRGLEIVNNIRVENKTTSIHIILLTSFHEESECNDLFDKYDLSYCLQIPLNPLLLLKSIDKCMNTKSIDAKK